MNSGSKKYLWILLMLVIPVTCILLLLKFPNSEKKIVPPPSYRSYSEIQNSGYLRMSAVVNPYGFFIEGDTSGFFYELATKLCFKLQLKPKFVLAPNQKAALDSVRLNKADVCIDAMIGSAPLTKTYLFSNGVFTTRQILIQAKHGQSSKPVRNIYDLADKEIMVNHRTPYETRLLNIQDEYGIPIKLIYPDSFTSTEKLIRKVANGELKYTVADEMIAQSMALELPGIDVDMALGLPQQASWAVLKDNLVLKDTINRWLGSSEIKKHIGKLLKKYPNRKHASFLAVNDAYFKANGSLSPFDELIKKYVRRINYDWRLIASLIYQESNFIPDIESYRGAQGLMQLMPQTGINYGADDLMDPEQNVGAGVQYIKYLDDFWRKQVPDSSDRTRFVLASYNTGHGNILKACKNAEARGLDKSKWESNVSLAVDDLGGGEAINAFVDEVIARFYIYKEMVPR